LLSYYNQRDHRILDRQLLPSLLSALATAAVRTSPRPEPRQEHVARLKRLAQSELEKRFVDLLDRRGLKLPSDAQALIEICSVRPDFLYRVEGAAIFIDGPHHDHDGQRKTDRAQQDALEDQGYSVVRFHHAADWLEVLRSFPSVFGQLPSMPPPGTSAPPDAGSLEIDLTDFDAPWRPVVSELLQRGAMVTAVGDVADTTGRVVGQCVAEVSSGSQTIFLLDASDADAAAVAASLERQGKVALPLHSTQPDLADTVLNAMSPAGSNP
jgi:very-short-patch-repair endonuclease